MSLREIVRELDLLIAALDVHASELGQNAETVEGAKAHRKAVVIWLQAKELRSKLVS
jgi:hypothetical protein